MTAPRTFPAYIVERAPAGVPGFPADFVSRVRHVNLSSLRALQNWTRERYPDFYQQPVGGNGAPGQWYVKKLWAAYLAWAEA